ncbi:hypothetical protein ACIG8K_03560 [Streptomyces halstedii]|uniref:hypothetical protein n=1 Tax=Streptomyces halstedii TaxID=1944 RepID=UPI0037D80EDA
MTVIETLGLPNTRGRAPLIVAQVATPWATGLFLPFAVVYFHRAKGIELTTVGLMLSVAERYRRPRVLQVAAVLFVVSFAMFAAVPGGHSQVAFAGLALGMVVFTVAELLQAPTSSAMIVAIAAEHLRGRYLGLEELMWGVARVMAPTVFTWLLVKGPALPWLMLGLCCLSAVVVLHRLGRVLPADVQRDTVHG